MISPPSTTERINDLIAMFDRGEPVAAAAPDLAKVLKTEVRERDTLSERLTKAEQQLRPLRMIFQEAAMGMALVGTDGRFLTVNPALCKMFGYLESELLELTVDGVTNPEDRALDAHLARRVWASEVRSYRTEKRYVRKDGRNIVARATTSSIRSPSGHATFGVVIVEKIEECGPAGQRSRQTDKTWEAAASAADVGTWELTPKTGEMVWSAQLDALLGYVEGDLKPNWLPFLAMVHAEDQRAMGEALQAHLAGSTPRYDAEFRIRHNDGSYRWINLRGKAILDAQGEPARVVGLYLDITARKQIHLPALTGSVSQSSTVEVIKESSAYVRCKACHSADISASRPKWWDLFARLLFRRPFRCQACGNRFYASKWLRPSIGINAG